jgi:hypothetical protein
MIDPREAMVRAEILGTEEMIEAMHSPPDDMFVEEMYDY